VSNFPLLIIIVRTSYILMRW